MKLLPHNAFALRAGRVYATPLLSDELHAVRNDPFAAAMAVIRVVPALRLARANRERLMCTSFNAIDPPARIILRAHLAQTQRFFTSYA